MVHLSNAYNHILKPIIKMSSCRNLSTQKRFTKKKKKTFFLIIISPQTDNLKPKKPCH